MSWQIRSRIFVIAITVVLGVSVRAVTDWVSDTSLGDVAVSFDTKVQVFDDISPVDDITVTGPNGGLAFDASLNLLVANTAGGQLVKLAPGTSHAASNIDSQPSPSALSIAADGTIYVARSGSPNAFIERIDPAYACTTSITGCPQFSVPSDSATCVGIDLSPDQSTLFYVSGGRTIRTVTGVNTSSPVVSPNPFTTLTGTGTACGIRLLAPRDTRDAVLTLTDTVGEILVADAKDIKLVRASGVTSFDTGTGTKNWIDVAVDPDAAAPNPSVIDFWGVNAGNSPRLAKFRAAGPAPSSPLPSIALSGTPRGVAVNGELRVAQTVQLVELTNGSEKEATFLQGTTYQHSWKGLTTGIVLPTTSLKLAVQAIEVNHIDDEALPCSPLNVDCRLRTNFPAATPKNYSRKRGVVYREIQRDANLSNPELRIVISYPGDTDTSAGMVCTVDGIPKSGTTILRDPWPHQVFTDDLMEAFYGGDDGGIIRTRTNDSIVVNRSDAQYFLRIIKPAPLTQNQIGRSVQIAVEVRQRPNCNFVSGLNDELVLTVTDITPITPLIHDKGKIIGDSQGLLGILNGNGLTWASTANQYRTNLDLNAIATNPAFPNSKFIAGHTYRACVMSPAFYDTAELPIVGEACVDLSVKN